MTTATEINKELIAKGYKEMTSIILAENKWGADYFTFAELEDGKSYIALYKNITEFASKKITTFSKMKSSDKKEFIKILP